MLRIAPKTPITESDLEGLAPFERWVKSERAIWAYRPEVRDAFDKVFAELRSTGSITPRLFELLRLRIGFHNQCRACMTVRYEPQLVGEDLVCSLEKPYEAPDLTDAEKAALRFGDLFATNHLAIDQSVFDDLRQFFDEGELVELSSICAMFIGIGRIAAVWRVYDEFPMSEWPADGVTFTPWASGVTIDATFGAGAATELV